MKRILTCLTICLLATAAHGEIRITDDSGKLIRLAAPAKRIVSLAPHITETLFAAGVGGAVVGSVDYADYPEAAARLPRVGGYTKLDLEAVAALKPDLVIGWQSGNVAGHIERLRALGLPLYLSQPGRIDDIARNLEHFGVLGGNEAAGREAAARLRARHADLQQRYAGRPPVTVFYQAWKQPLMTVSGRQIISDVIRLCGGVNVFADLLGMAPNVTVEAVIAANPEAIVASGMAEERPEWLDDWRRWTAITAVARGNLFFIPPALIQRHTPRLLDGAERLCGQLDEARRRRPK
jgi:iron complex transport system substrate-binding protein